jgi:uncharacterized membrane protein
MTAKAPITGKEIAQGFKAFMNDARLVAFLNYALLMFTVMTFGLTSLIAMLIANFAEDKGPDWIRSHYEYQKRSFWYGIGPVLICAVAYTFVQRHGINNPVITTVMLGVVLLTLGYTVGRAIMGFNHIMHDRPIPNPKAWLV